MPRLFARLSAAVFAVLALVPATPGRATAYDGKPKLVIILVLDQFRGDYLDRFRADFKTANGFNLFLKKGAYFPNCYYEYANTMTAPGHSTIGTGAYTNGHNIAINDWWQIDRVKGHMVSSVEDEDTQLVGGPAGVGASPRNEQASTLGDEVVLSTGGKGRLFGISLKDRASILTSGHASRAAYWLDHASGQWVTSTYWMDSLPDWVARWNAGTAAADARRSSGVGAGDFYDKVGATQAGVRYELDFAQALIQNERLGRDEAADVLTLSLSSTDILGHRVGPDAPEQRALIDGIDVELDRFFTALDKQIPGGLANVWVAFSADHGVAPRPVVAAADGMPAGTFSGAAMNAELNKELNARLSHGGSEKFILGGDLPYVQLDPAPFQAAKLDERAAEQLVAELLPDALLTSEAARRTAPVKRGSVHPASVRRVYTKSQIAAGEVPNTEEGRLILNSFSTNGGWWVMMSPGMYSMSGYENGGTTHFTPYAYDRHVPLAFFGTPFVPGTYLNPAAPVDIAATFAALLRINKPTACVGRVVTEAIRPEPGSLVHAGPTASRR